MGRESAVGTPPNPLLNLHYVELNPFGIALIKYFHNFYFQILNSANIMIQNKSN